MTYFAILYDIKEDLKILGYAEQDEDGLFYVVDDGSTEPADLKMKEGRKLQANMTASVHLSIQVCLVLYQHF